MKQDVKFVMTVSALIGAAFLFVAPAVAQEKFLPPAPIGDVGAATANVGNTPAAPVVGTIKAPTIVQPSAKDMPTIMPQIKIAPPPVIELPKVDTVHSDKPKQDSKNTEKLNTKAVKDPAVKAPAAKVTKDTKPDSEEETDSDEASDSNNKDKSTK